MQPADCYKILGVPVGASIEEITVAYKKLSEKFHPSANAGDPFFQNRLKEVEEAYQTLTNLTSVALSTPTRITRGKVIGGAIFGILLIAVTVFKFVSETKKVSETRQTLRSLDLLPKDSGNTQSGSGSSGAPSHQYFKRRDLYNGNDR
jgi:curved DNA-binding protein CbpA